LALGVCPFAGSGDCPTDDFVSPNLKIRAKQLVYRGRKPQSPSLAITLWRTIRTNNIYRQTLNVSCHRQLTHVCGFTVTDHGLTDY